LADNQLDEALKQFKLLAEADPEDTEALIHIGEIQRRQSHYEDALATIRKARKQDPTSLEAGYNEALLLDVLGRFDEAAQTYEKMVDQTSHANGAYTNEEKSNRGFFLERLGAVYHEENKTDQSIAAYQKMIDMGGDTAVRGYEAQVEVLGEVKSFDKAAEVAKKAVDANPKNEDLKLMLAGALVEQGKNEEALTLTKSLLENTDKDRLVWLKLGQFYTEMRRWKDAEDAYAKATPMSTKNDDKAYLLFLKGALAERQKHFEPAEQFFRQALDIDPNSAMTLNYLGYMLADKGIRLPEALKLIRKAVELDPMNGAYLDSNWGSMSWPRKISTRPSSATSPTPRSTIIWPISTRRPAASAWLPRSGSSRWRSTPSPRRPTSSRARWPRYSASSKAPASSWPSRTAPSARRPKSSKPAGCPIHFTASS
jgi:tetratricopeptide (TPR) repeat protein